ncbi:MAG: hypothetical protein HY543_08285, partial [Deltaproteobacteria bacterium]|nr:hypothetical protein [Deltaproteobacteria bacterium]
QPLLEKALKKWEKQTGRSINVVEGNSAELPLYRHGFSKPAPTSVPTRRRPPAKPQTPPADDVIPDLEDLKF